MFLSVVPPIMCFSWKHLFFLFLVVTCKCTTSLPVHASHKYMLYGTEDVVTYSNIHGRLGDALLAYMRAKWVSYKYHLPLLYKPFFYSDQLKMHVNELLYQQHRYHFDQETTLQNISILEESTQRPTVFDLPYFPENLQEYGDFIGITKCSWFQVDWEDRDFRALLRKQIAPRRELKLITLASDRITVAVHVRLGGGFDVPDAANMWPLKFPPLSWYRDQLLYVSSLYGNRKIYVYIFTDDPYPQRLKSYFKDTLPSNKITFDCRTASNRYDVNVLEDLFSMAQFDCLIRPMSNLSFTAGVIGRAKLIIYPTSYHRIPGGFAIDDTCILRRKTLGLKRPNH